MLAWDPWQPWQVRAGLVTWGGGDMGSFLPPLSAVDVCVHARYEKYTLEKT